MIGWRRLCASAAGASAKEQASATASGLAQADEKRRFNFKRNLAWRDRNSRNMARARRPSAAALAERRRSGKASSVEDRRALRRSGRSAQFSRLPRLSTAGLRRRVELAAFAAAALGGALSGQRPIALVGDNRRDDGGDG